jgi:hypothetical protein
MLNRALYAAHAIRQRRKDDNRSGRALSQKVRNQLALCLLMILYLFPRALHFA